MKTLYIMQGVPGSGKSTVARKLADAIDPKEHSVICSTDDLRYRNGVYVHDPGANAELHAQNMRHVIANMEEGVEHIFVDNTNIKRIQARPYIAFAQAFGYQVQIIRVQCSVEKAAARQAYHTVDRRVPKDVIQRMASEMEDLGEEL